MCGIVGIVSNSVFSVKQELLGALSRLDYRGYDSAGLATRDGELLKKKGDIANLELTEDIGTTVGIAHTRWATHGDVSELNAHPHTNEEENVFIVHNGIIENASTLTQQLKDLGYTFRSQTDSELVAHYVDYYLKEGYDLHGIAQRFFRDVEGTFAILVLIKGRNELLCLKRDSPLAIGIGEDRLYVASDIHAFSDRTEQAVFMEDDEYALVSADQEAGFRLFDQHGTPLERERTTFHIPETSLSREQFDHYMLKEIYEQPEAAARLLTSFRSQQPKNVERFVQQIRDARRVMFVACGTSYHAALIGVSMLQQCNIDAQAIIASEFENFLLVNEDTLVVPLSQSGETMDVVRVVKSARKRGARVASIVNVPYSTIQRHSEVSLETMAGTEKCVASTKVFTNQVVVLQQLASRLGHGNGADRIPDGLRRTLQENEGPIQTLAEKLHLKKDIFVLGRALSYPVAREIALKFKEIAYIHAEGMMAGELKHGTIALIEDHTPVIALQPSDTPDMDANTEEVRARGGDVISISDTSGDLVVPAEDGVQFSIYATMIGHLLSYYVAKRNSLPIDKPRNLAKSVTVK